VHNRFSLVLTTPEMPFLPEPAYTHGTPPAVGVMLVNLGTPDAPTPAAVRRYLKEFLSDPRVVEIPRAVWLAILNGIILNTRPRKSAQKYAVIWTEAGSPLKVHTERQAELLHSNLARLGVRAEVEWAMRYGNPSIREGFEALRARGCDRLLVVPMYPQYAASTTASTYDAVFDVLRRIRNVPALRLVKHFHDDPGYITALAKSVEEHWAVHGEPDHLVMSFHGLPQFALDRGDPYHCECQKTGRLLAEAIGLPKARYTVSFQSRFGRAQWLKPYTMDTMAALAQGGTQRIDVICPGFTADCLETLEEIAIENRRAFEAAGGREFRYIPCLNERPDWIEALGRVVVDNLTGWLAPAPLPADAGASRERALALGAPD